MSQSKPKNNRFSLPQCSAKSMQGLEEGVGAALYFASSTVIRHFFQPLGATGFKLGQSGRRDVDDRILDLRRKKY